MPDGFAQKCGHTVSYTRCCSFGLLLLSLCTRMINPKKGGDFFTFFVFFGRGGKKKRENLYTRDDFESSSSSKRRKRLFCARAIGVARFFSLLDFVLSLSFSFARKTIVCYRASCRASPENGEQRTEREREKKKKKIANCVREEGSIVGEQPTTERKEFVCRRTPPPPPRGERIKMRSNRRTNDVEWPLERRLRKPKTSPTRKSPCFTARIAKRTFQTS